MKRVLMMCFINFMIIICLSGCSATNTGEIIENKPFYSLQAAYNNEIISKKDLRKIKQQLGEENYIELDEKIADQIINDYIEANPQFKETKVTINKYLGTYDGAVVLMISSDAQLFQNVLTIELISGISFNYKSSQKILIWKEWV